MISITKVLTRIPRARYDEDPTTDGRIICGPRIRLSECPFTLPQNRKKKPYIRICCIYLTYLLYNYKRQRHKRTFENRLKHDLSKTYKDSPDIFGEKRRFDILKVYHKVDL